MHRNRRAEAQARALLSQAESAIARAAAQLFDGDALTAMRTLRTAEQLAALDSRLRARRAADIQMRRQLAEAERALDAKAAELRRREAVLDAREERIAADTERLKATAGTLETAYALLLAKGSDEADGPAPATATKTAAGVAPL